MTAAKRQDPGPAPGAYGFGFLAGKKDPETGEFPKTGKIYMIRCYKCGRENYTMMVATGRCAWCGYDANGDAALAVEFENLDAYQRQCGYRKVIA